MNTPIADFVKKYADSDYTRFHMPGHKGKSVLGIEHFDITEVRGADALYEAEGIILESEKNASKLFGTGKTLYSTEGSSQCIKAMLYLAMNYQRTKAGDLSESIEADSWSGKKRPYVIAARNVHKAFLYGIALLDLDVKWLYPETMHSLCSCIVNASELEAMLSEQEYPPMAVYITSPDYLGGVSDIEKLAEICHKYHTLLAVDNAHGAYLHFLKKERHPMDLGADICCDSAHKTLPVLTGGAYLHINRKAPDFFKENAKQAMALFGSTSPSYLTLMSLDLCNKYLADRYGRELDEMIQMVRKAKSILKKNDWEIAETEELKIVLCCPEAMNGYELSKCLHGEKMECEYADKKYLVCMITPENTQKDLDKLVQMLGKNTYGDTKYEVMTPVKSCAGKLSVRQAVFAVQEKISTEKAEGRICASVTVSCPPAIPIVCPGEVITKEAIELLKYYEMDEVSVVR